MLKKLNPALMVGTIVALLLSVSCTPDGYITNEVVTYNGTGQPGQGNDINVLPFVFLAFVLCAVFVNVVAKSVTLGAVVVVLCVGGIVANVTTMNNNYLNLAFAVTAIGTVVGLAWQGRTK